MRYVNTLSTASLPLIAFSLVTLLTLHACSGDGKKETKEPVGDKSSPASAGSSGSPSEDTASIGADRKLLVNSLSNNGSTSFTINRAKATEMATSLSSNKSKDAQTNYGIIVANRLAGKLPQESFDEARAIIDRAIAKNPDAELPEPVQLEMAFTALHANKLALAEFYLDKLVKSKTPHIKAAAINALGVVAIRMERIPEAVATFKEALGADKEYKPALLNIGFLALQGGDAATAKRALAGMQDDWFVDGGLISVDRLDGDTDKADQRCERVLSKHPKHKPTLINCGINAYQGKRDFKKARDYLNRAIASQGGSPAWDEKTGKLLGVVDSEEARAGQLKAAKEAEERAEKAKAEKAKADAAAAKPPQGAAAGGAAPAAGGAPAEQKKPQ